ncbi:MAG TPA: hypothetical protein VN921_00110 [Chthoniobacterales bacterium]|nr:hypothetical protein [Chthoniobacterales bacterium]
MIARLVEWFGSSPLPYYVVGLSALAVFVALTLVRESERADKLRFDCAFILAAGLTLLAWRWPNFLWQYPLNPDEGLWVAGALKVKTDWVPWRGFDGATSGPLTAYTLALPALVGARIDFFSARFLGVCLLTLTMGGLYFAVKWLNGGRVARLAVLPAVLLLALTRDWNFLHFSSETVPIFLTTTALAASAYLARERMPERRRLAACAIAGVCLGSAGLAKLQSLPIAFVLLGFVLAGIFFGGGRRWKGAIPEVLVFAASLAFVPAIVTAVLGATGQLRYAIRSYLQSSVGYVGEGIHIGPSFLFESSASYTAFLVGALIIVFLGVAMIFWKRHALSRRSLLMAAASVLLVVAAGFAIYVPRRPFQHYLLLSVVPVSCCLAAVLRLVRETSFPKGREALITGTYVSVFLISALGVPLSAGPSTLVTEIAFNSKSAGSKQAVALSRYAPRGSRVAIWGSCPELYVQTGTVMATRYGQMGPIPAGHFQQYYQGILMGDLERSRPAVFVDAVHPGAFQFNNRATQGHETFPALAAFVRQNFQFREEVGGVRIFVANGNTNSAPAETAAKSAVAADEPASWMVRFSAGSGSEIYRVSGWSGAEAEFTWTDGTSAKLKLPIPDHDGPLTLRMKLGGLIQPRELPVQNVAVYANGEKIADWQVGEPADFTAPIPLELTRNAEDLNIKLRIPDAASPQSLGMSYDGRLLGVRCYFVELRRR